MALVSVSQKNLNAIWPTAVPIGSKIGARTALATVTCRVSATPLASLSAQSVHVLPKKRLCPRPRTSVSAVFQTGSRSSNTLGAGGQLGQVDRAIDSVAAFKFKFSGFPGPASVSQKNWSMLVCSAHAGSSESTVTPAFPAPRPGAPWYSPAPLPLTPLSSFAAFSFAF